MKETLYDPSPAEREAIIQAVRRHLEAQPEVLFAYVYGSLLGDLPVHDVDVGIYLAEGQEATDPLWALDLAADLERALPAELRLPIDVRVLNDAPPDFQYHVYRGRFLFSRDDERWGRLVEFAIWRYLDMKPLLEWALKEALTA